MPLRLACSFSEWIGHFRCLSDPSRKQTDGGQINTARERRVVHNPFRSGSAQAALGIERARKLNGRPAAIQFASGKGNIPLASAPMRTAGQQPAHDPIDPFGHSLIGSGEQRGGSSQRGHPAANLSAPVWVFTTLMPLPALGGKSRRGLPGWASLGRETPARLIPSIRPAASPACLPADCPAGSDDFRWAHP